MNSLPVYIAERPPRPLSRLSPATRASLPKAGALSAAAAVRTAVISFFMTCLPLSCLPTPYLLQRECQAKPPDNVTYCADSGRDLSVVRRGCCSPVGLVSVCKTPALAYLGAL